MYAAAAARIGVDRLAAGEIEDRQQHQDCERDRADIDQASGAERDQDRQGRFGSIGGRGQAVETHRRDALEYTDLPLAVLAVGQRLADKKTQKRHGVVTLGGLAA